MIVELIGVYLFARFKKLNIRPLFYSWTFYPVLIVQILLIVFQVSIFFKSGAFIPFVPFIEPAIIGSFLFAMFVYGLYQPAIYGSVFIVAGSALNRFVMSQNGGKMPVFPSLSYLTGYVTPEMLGSMDSIHVLGSAETKFKILTDYIDIGYSILSPGDVLIHLFTCIMLYALIKATNRRYAELSQQ